MIPQATSRFLSRFLLPLQLLAAVGLVAVLWSGYRPGGGYDGIRIQTPFFDAEMRAHSPGIIGDAEEVNKSHMIPGFLHLGIWRSRGSDWSIARTASGKAQFYDLVDARKAIRWPIPVIIGSKVRGGWHICCGYPQAIGWLVFLAGLLMIRPIRTLLRQRAPRL